MKHLMPFYEKSQDNSGKTCPYCGKDIVGANCKDQESYGHSNGRMHRPAICPECGMGWTIVYRFEEVTETLKQAIDSEAILSERRKLSNV